jgi:hypothetical protein
MRALACGLVCCAALAGGCGFGGDEPERTAASADGRGGEAPAGTPAPTPTPQPLAYGSGVKAALAAGAIGVVDTTNRAGVEPRTLEVNREQVLSNLRWQGWGTPRTIARGEVSTLICEPDCATGTRESSRATIVLSAPRKCQGGRFYTRSSMTYVERETGKTRAPATYLRTPPC